ncbi:MAG: DNA replication/repair protein RecF [Bacilli bacterium]|nr:DNA replication/repair protein RecF [Bacilli bacterium]
MILTNLKLVNFRNYSKIDIKLNKKMNILIGNNGVGKTNILESIIILSLTKSFRTREDLNLIKIGEKKAKIIAKSKDKTIPKSLEVDIWENHKQLFINNNEVKKISDYISNLNVIVFTPDDLNIIKGSPSIRRNLLNVELSQLSKIYLNTYNEYNKILRTRNEYLKLLYTNSIADTKYLDVLTDKLIEKATKIYISRKEYIDKINDSINTIFSKISNKGTLRVEYLPNIEFDKYDEESIGKTMKKKYKDNYFKEINNKMTLYGPHRDDLNFYLNDQNLKLFGSQGEQRLSIIAYKIAEIGIFESITNTKPVLLFDDIFSELDIRKRNKLLNLIGSDIQSIITTTDLKNINKKYIEEASVFEIKKDNIIKKAGIK